MDLKQTFKTFLLNFLQNPLPEDIPQFGFLQGISFQTLNSNLSIHVAFQMLKERES